jgi:hypothetical protein
MVADGGGSGGGGDAATQAAAASAATAAAAAAAAQAGQPFHADWMKADGTLNPAAYDRLPEDVRYMKDTLAKYKTAEELVRGMAYTQTLNGKKGLIPLPANARPEVIAERKQVLDSINGVPKEAKDYGFKKPDGVPDALWRDAQAEGFSKWAHENSVSPAAANKLIGLQLEFAKSELAAEDARVKDFFDGHAKAFEAQCRTDNIPLDQANALAERGAAALGIDITKPEGEAIMKNSQVKLAMMRHAQATGEDTFVKGDTRNGGEGDPFAQVTDMVHNKANPLYEPLHNQSHPQHAMAKAKADGLWRQVAAAKKKP